MTMQEFKLQKINNFQTSYINFKYKSKNKRKINQNMNVTVTNGKQH